MFRLTTIQTCILCYSFWLPTKHNVRIDPKVLQINRVSCFHISFTYRSSCITVNFAPCMRSAFAHRGLFKSVHKILFSMHLPFAQSALTVPLACAHLSFKWENIKFQELYCSVYKLFIFHERYIGNFLSLLYTVHCVVMSS